jgi:anti-sigma B factor antagonist
MQGASRWDEPVCQVHWTGRQALAVLPVQVDSSNLDRVREQLLAAVDRGATVLIADMTATVSCDHAGIMVLERVYQRATAKGAELRLVVAEPAVRQVISLSGLDRLLPVFATLKAAQDRQTAVAAVVPLFAQAASTGPVSRRPPRGRHPASDASADNPGQAAQEAMSRHELSETLSRVTVGLFESGLALQTALDGPAGTMRVAVERVLDILGGTIRDVRAAEFAAHGYGAHGLAHDNGPGMGRRPGVQTGTGPLDANDHDAAGPHVPLAAARRARARSRLVRTRTLKVARRSATTEDRVAANMDDLAACHPLYSAHLQALSQAAASHATWIRQWAQDRAAGTRRFSPAGSAGHQSI